METKRKIIRLFLTGVLLAWGFGFSGWAQVPVPQESAERLRREIRLLNLVNGLELTPAQLSLVLSGAEEIRTLREGYASSLQSRAAELENTLKEIKTSVQENKEIPADVVRRFHALEREEKKARLEVEEKAQALAKDVEKSLQPHQIYQLERYVPCIIPPKGESRIGQAVDSKGIGQKLERIRGLPGRIYERRREIICERTVEEIRLRAGRLPGFDEAEIAGKIGSFFDRVRSLSEVDFEIQKGKLAEEFLSFAKPLRPSPDLSRKIEAFLLSPDIIPVLERMAASGRARG